MKSNFYVISKTTQNFSDYLSGTIRLSNQIPQTVKEVLIANKKGKVRGKITTFLDKEGNVIEKAFNIKDKPLKNRIYTSQKNHIGTDEVVTSTQIKEYTLNRKLIDIYRKHMNRFINLDTRTYFWEQESIQTNHMANNTALGIKNLTISRIQNLKNIPLQFLHSFTQYKPIVNNKISKNSPIKYIEYIVNDKFIALKSSIHTINMKRPKFDSFLGLEL